MKAKKLLSIILSLCMVLSVIPMTSTTAFAAQSAVEYLYPVYKKTDGTFYENCSSGIKEWKTGSCTSATAVTSDDTTWGTAGTESWYVASGKVEIDHSVTIVGTVNLVLADYATLTITDSANSVIANYGEGNNFNVYAQSTGENMGELLVTGGISNSFSYAGIESTGGATVTINGGYVTAKSSSTGAGIGGGINGADGSNITVNGGDVTAENTSNGTGIGGGRNGNGENITINGGNVTAKGKVWGAGIGGGSCDNTGDNIRRGGDCTNVTINGGYVESESSSGCGIGSGAGGDCSFISITGGTVKATSEDVAIGAHTATTFTNFGGEVHDITISGGTVIATSTSGGCGIGGASSHSEELGFHHYANVYNITISGEDTNVTATGCGSERFGGAGIGTYNGGDVKNITIKDGCTVIATGSSCAPGIGSGSNSGEYFGTTSDITISGEGTKVIATAGSNTNGAPGIGSCADASNITISDAEVYATGSGRSAGIGSGQYGDASGITLSNCKVTAITGSDYGAGIGAGYGHSASDITITNSNVTAKGGNDAAGIGGGKGGNATNITISGDSYITAVAGNELGGTAIGAGKGGTATGIKVDASLFIAANEDETLSEYNAIFDTRTSDDDISATLSATNSAEKFFYRCAVIKPRDAYVAQVGEGDTAVKYLFVQTAIDKVIKELSYLRKNESGRYLIDDPSSANIEVDECTNLDNITITMIADSSEEIDIQSINAGVYLVEYDCYSDDLGFGYAYLCQNITLNLNDHTLSAFFDSGESVVSIGKNQTLTVKDGCITGASARRWDQDKIDICCGVYNKGTFNMTSGTITGNNVDGGVYNNGIMTVGGTVVIEGNTLNGETVQNLYLTSGKKVAISSETPFVEGANIGITTETVPTAGSPVEFATSATKNDETNDEDYFFSDSTAYVDQYYYAGTALDLILGNRVTALESENGSVSVGNQKSAYDGEKIKVKVTPDDGYALDEVTIKKAEDSTDITETVGYDETSGTFTMPAYEVTVSATFKEDIPETVKSATYSVSLTLSDNVTINLFVNGTKSYDITSDASKYKLYADGEEVTLSATDNNRLKGLFNDFDATGFDKEISFVFKYDDTVIKSVNYSVIKYCNAFKAQNNDLGRLCKAIILYNQAADVYADYVNNEVTAETTQKYNDTNSALSGVKVSAAAIQKYVSGEITFTMSLESNIKIILGIEGYDAGDLILAYGSGADMKYVPVTVENGVITANISASMLRTKYTVYDSEGFTKSGTSYMISKGIIDDYKILDIVPNYYYYYQVNENTGATDQLKLICKAMYNYGVCTTAYAGE